jgi:hypothetical protein
LEEGVYRTDDLALATTLALRGYEYEMVKLTQRKVVWDFIFKDEQEEDFHDIVSDFWEFCAVVEPRAFTLRWAEMRRELFRLVPPNNRQPVQPASAA